MRNRVSNFGDYKHVITRKVHRCAYCDRDIPVGLTARQFKGMLEGDWRNWYTCGFCEEIIEPEQGDPFGWMTGDEFPEWFRDSVLFRKCPNGHILKWPRHNSWVWFDGTTIEVECGECGEMLKIHIPFEIIKSPLPTE